MPSNVKSQNSNVPIRVIILAAGKGKRMGGGDLPKVLHPLAGRPMLARLLAAVEASGVDARPIVVVGHMAGKVEEACAGSCEIAIQERQLGTGDAVKSAMDALDGRAGHVLVLYGDMPLISHRTVRKIADMHLASGADMTLATAALEDFEGWRAGFADFGRILRSPDGRVSRIVETRDASPEERAVLEVNPGIYAFRADWLAERLGALKAENAQGEYYLTDLLGMAVKEGARVAAVPIPAEEIIGINTPEQLALAERLLKERGEA